MFRANFQRTGCYQSKDIRTINNTKWKFQQTCNLPSLNPGHNYLFTIYSNILCVENSQGHVYGLNLDSGQQIWKQNFEKINKIVHLSTANDLLFVGTRPFDNFIESGYLRAMNINSGEPIWKFKIPFTSTSVSFNSLLSCSAPVVYENNVYIGANDGNIYALNIDSGEVSWSFKTTKNMSLNSPAIQENILCIYSSDGYIYMIDLSTQLEKWKFEVGGGGISNLFLSPVIHKETVYVVDGDGILYALDIETGNILWTFSAHRQPLYSAAITDDHVCINCKNGNLYTLNPKTGEIFWEYKVGQIKSYNNPVVTKETVYFGNQGFIQALDLKTGEQLWRFETPFSDCWVLDSKMWLYGLTNQIIKSFTGDTHNLENFSEPIIINQTLYVSCSNGYIYALN